METVDIFLSLLFGCIGFGYFMHCKLSLNTLTLTTNTLVDQLRTCTYGVHVSLAEMCND